jgi:hypothetical protein
MAVRGTHRGLLTNCQPRTEVSGSFSVLGLS